MHQTNCNLSHSEPHPILQAKAIPGAENPYWLSSRIWHGRDVQDLLAMGLKLTGRCRGNYIEMLLPVGWTVVDSGVSDFQKRLLDDTGAIRARLYYQPGSAGGGMEMCLEQDAS